MTGRFKRFRESIPWLKFKKQKIGMISLIVLTVMYLSILFEGFIAPYNANTKFKTKSYHPPHRVHLFHENRFLGPFVYEYEMVNPYFKTYRTDRNKIHKIGLFVKGDPYKIMFLFPSDRHLFGTADGSPYFPIGNRQARAGYFFKNYLWRENFPYNRLCQYFHGPFRRYSNRGALRLYRGNIGLVCHEKLRSNNSTSYILFFSFSPLHTSGRYNACAEVLLHNPDPCHSRLGREAHGE